MSADIAQAVEIPVGDMIGDPSASGHGTTLEIPVPDTPEVSTASGIDLPTEVSAELQANPQYQEAINKFTEVEKTLETFKSEYEVLEPVKQDAITLVNALTTIQPLDDKGTLTAADYAKLEDAYQAIRNMDAVGSGLLAGHMFSRYAENIFGVGIAEIMTALDAYKNPQSQQIITQAAPVSIEDPLQASLGEELEYLRQTQPALADYIVKNMTAAQLQQAQARPAPQITPKPEVVDAPSTSVPADYNNNIEAFNSQFNGVIDELLNDWQIDKTTRKGKALINEMRDSIKSNPADLAMVAEAQNLAGMGRKVSANRSVQSIQTIIKRNFGVVANDMLGPEYKAALETAAAAKKKAEAITQTNIIGSSGLAGSINKQQEETLDEKIHRMYSEGK